MSSYNNIEKIKYASEDCVVTLREYIVFEDERAEEKYVVFKFANNVSQQLLGMEFEVSQYDIDGNTVEKSVVIYNKFLAKPDEQFVPKAKLKLNYLCKTLSVRLIQAAFDRFVWKEGQYLDNSYKFEHYARDEDTEAAKNAVPVKHVKVKDPKPEPAPVKRKGRLPFTAKNTMRKNIAKFPGVFNFFVCILIFAAIGVSIYFFNTRSTAFTIDNYDLKIMDSDAKTVAVTGYDGDSKNLNIPATIGDYTVVRISENAFKDSDIQSVKFNSSKLYIESYAFEGCTELKSVSSTAEATVLSNAFKDCTKLTTVTLPNAAVVSGSFNNCKSITYLEFGSTAAESVAALFGGKAPANVSVIVTGGGYLPDELPDDGNQDGGSQGSGFVYDPEKTYEYGELDGKGVAGYKRYNDFETVDGTIITLSPYASYDLVLPKEVKDISEKVYDRLYIFSSLTIEGNTVITPEVASMFVNVYMLDVAYGESVKDSLYCFANASVLSLPCYNDTPLTWQYNFGYEVYSQITLKPSSGCTTVPNAAFSGIYVISIVIEKGFTFCSSNIVSYNSNLTFISLPEGISYGKGVIGKGCNSLETVDVYIDNFGITYDSFNLSYTYTKNLIIRTYDLNGYGYLANCRLNNFNYIEIYASTASVTLWDFVCGSIYSYNLPYALIFIPDYPDNFGDWYNGYIEYFY